MTTSTASAPAAPSDSKNVAPPMARDAALDIFADVVAARRTVIDSEGGDHVESLLSGDVKVSDLPKGEHTIASAQAMLGAVASHHHDRQHEAATGRPRTSNGWPCTSHRGVEICLREVVEVAGKNVFVAPSRLDGGR